MNETDARLREMERRIQVLEEENAILAERAEESLLLALAAEAISSVEGPSAVLETVLERISILVDLTYAGCFANREGTWQQISAYAAYATRAETLQHGGLRLSPERYQELDRGPLVTRLAPSDEVVLSLPGRPRSDVSGTVGLFPFDSISLGPGAFVFLDESGGPDRLQLRAAMLTHVVEMVTDRLDVSALAVKLHEINAELDQRVEDRTAELRQSERRYRTLFHAISDAVFLWKVDEDSKPGRCLECNEAAEALLGRTRAELLLLDRLDIWRPKSSEEIADIDRQLNLNHQASFVTRAVTAKGDEVPVSVTMRVLSYEGSQVALALVRDITETQRLQEQLQQSQRMEAVGRLAGGIAHDLNNQLAALSASAELAMMELAKPHPAYGDLEQILDIVERSASLNRKLLTFSQSHVTDARVLDLNPIFSEAQRLLERVIGEDVQLTCAPAPEVVWVHCDPTQIEQVIVNLAVNARDAMPGGGRLCIELGVVELTKHDEVLPVDLPSDHYAHLKVTDTGNGIGPEVLPHIFEPFFTTKAAQGTGLGLSTVYGIINQSGGFLRVESEPNQGTTFHVYLPISSEGPSPQLPRPALPTARTGSETILVVEDDAHVRKLMVRYLTRLGYHILEAPLPTVALELWQRQSQEIDLLITDVVMPQMRGPELIERLRADAPQLPVLLTSGHASGMLASTDELEQGVAFLPKPVRLQDLAHHIRTLLENNPQGRK